MAVAKPRFSPLQILEHKDMLATIRNVALKFAPNDPALRDDLQQVAYLAILKRDGVFTLAYYRSLVTWRVRDFIRRERLELSRGEEKWTDGRKTHV